jgi:hypothetical protein
MKNKIVIGSETLLLAAAGVLNLLPVTPSGAGPSLAMGGVFWPLRV